MRGRSTLSARNVISLLALVRCGAGPTLLPALATLSSGADLPALLFALPLALREVGIILRHGKTPSPVCRVLQSKIAQARLTDHPATAGGLGDAHRAAQ